MRKQTRRVIKLTCADGTTRRGFLYVPGCPERAPGRGELCTAAYLHAYRTEREAAFFRPLHGVEAYDTAWVAEAVVERENATKLGCTRLTIRRRTTLPPISIETRVTAAILSALERYRPNADRGAYGAWAEGWLAGEDRSEASAAESAWAAEASAASAWAAEAASAAEAEAARAESAWASQAARVDVDAMLEALGVPRTGGA